MECVIHYKGYEKSRYTRLKVLSSVNIEGIQNAKIEREKYSDSRYHEQCTMVPDVIDSLKHGVHLQPCYAIFTQILSKCVPLAKESTSLENISLISPDELVTSILPE